MYYGHSTCTTAIVHVGLHQVLVQVLLECMLYPAPTLVSFFFVDAVIKACCNCWFLLYALCGLVKNMLLMLSRASRHSMMLWKTCCKRSFRVVCTRCSCEKTCCTCSVLKPVGVAHQWLLARVWCCQTAAAYVYSWLCARTDVVDYLLQMLIHGCAHSVFLRKPAADAHWWFCALGALVKNLLQLLISKVCVYIYIYI